MMLTPIDPTQITRSLIPSSSSLFTECQAQLLILDGQYVLRYHDEQQLVTKLISPEAVRQAFTQIPVDSGFLPPGVVRWGICPEGEWWVQFIPAARYQLRVDFDTELLLLDVPLPSLVFLGIRNRYYLWATQLKRFNPQGKVYHVPLPNVSSQGLICFGQNQVLPAQSNQIEPMWDLFCSSPFNGDSVGGKSKAYPEDVRQQLLALHQEKKRSYPRRDLEPASSRNFADVIETVISSCHL